MYLKIAEFDQVEGRETIVQITHMRFEGHEDAGVIGIVPCIGNLQEVVVDKDLYAEIEESLTTEKIVTVKHTSGENPIYCTLV